MTMISAKKLVPKIRKWEQEDPGDITIPISTGGTGTTPIPGANIQINVPNGNAAITITPNGEVNIDGQVNVRKSLILPEIDFSQPGTIGQIGISNKNGCLYVFSNHGWSKLS